MEIETQSRNILIAFGALSAVGLIVAIVRTSIWFSKSRKEIIDLPTIGKLLLHIAGIQGTMITIIVAGVSLWWLLFFRKDLNPSFDSRTRSAQNLIKILLIVGFGLKTIDVIHVVLRQSSIHIFLMDWERPKGGDPSKVSVWRTCFVANELNEIQTFRRIHLPFQLFFVLFLLKVIHLEDLARIESDFHLSTFAVVNTNDTDVKFNSVLRTGAGFFIFFCTAFLQYLTYTLFYQRFVEDKIMNFIDLCSVSNVSLFILDQDHHGHYIHGRSPHGASDVNMKDMIKNLERETQLMSGTRGLVVNSTDQIFIMKINRRFRRQYDSFYRASDTYRHLPTRQRQTEHAVDILFESYYNLNGFLCAFIDHSLPMQHYFIRNRYLLERILNYEIPMRMPIDSREQIENFLFIDHEKTFTQILFYGEENTLFIWNTLTFLIFDYFSMNFVLAAIITYLFNQIIVNIRNSLGRRNLSRKTMIPKEFLI